MDIQELLKSLGLSVARGVPQMASGFVDLAALPFTATGLLKPEQAVGSTDWMTARGYLPPKQEGLLSESAELASSMLSPAGAANAGLLALGMAANKGAKSLRSIAPLANPSKFVPGVEAGQEMIVQHNLKPRSVLFAEEFGGLPVPSLGVSKVSEPLSDFGDISLIGTKEMATPSGKNPVYAFDAYTKRNPKVFTEIKPEFKKDVTAELTQGFGKFANDRDALGEASMAIENVRDNLDIGIGKMQFLREIGQLPDPNQFDSYYDFSRAARFKFDELRMEDPSIFDKQSEWAFNKFREFQDRGVTDDLIYKGRTPTGKQKFEPATMDALVKATKGAAGEESTTNITLGALRAKIAPKFKKFEDVQAARERIVPQETFNAMRDDIAARNEDILWKLGNIAKENGVNLNYDGLRDLTEDLYLNQIGKYDYSKKLVGKIPQELLDEAEQFKKDLAALPTQYFEAKPQRAVPLSEFAGAIVPAETPQSVIDSLNRQGLTKIYKYKDNEERAKLVQKFGDKMFQVGAGTGIGVGGLLSLEEEQY